MSAELSETCLEIASAAKAASRQLATLDTTIKNRWLLDSADALVAATPTILAANERDLAAAPDYGLTDASIDRLRLDAGRIEGIATGLREIAALKDPIGEILDGFTRPGGMRIEKRRVPLGVVFFIYESRPNVTADAAGICVKSGNAVILRGGKEAMHSSRAIVDVLSEVARKVGVPEHAVQLVATTDRAAVGHFLKMDKQIDVTIPRGGEGLIRRVASEATMPVIKHYNGNCHVYVDANADIDMAVSVVENAKCHRLGVCNACESLLVHEKIAAEVLPKIAERLTSRGIEMRVDERAAKYVSDGVPATPEDFATEYLGPTISIAVVDSLDAATDHIAEYGSGHTEAIITNDIATAEQFTNLVDSAAVMVNASTRFNDGGMFGLGAEIGISTDKFHARGPCGLRELTSYKYIVRGNGHIRS
ncbi:glutamate-5-semialdehyde dehydrogenase [Allorhodopirellula heiligendammensis]|uniref:Gamma-glutamyl phosphate reductase n=1 Tax=Allorhodopirellula heiligendammensis TaxID=2714739 RepID=A0A5C6BYP1_9BACT|nr:glutamate-5-semialdehyde dehydrogenase [Allorhodopirellula heiligendammensis]TWU15739.1 Gamma-glutamyl phosphate reductase [Allorhodopirellula heiligendammensis]